MGTITSRKRRDGTAGFTAQIRLKRDGKIVFTEAQTFDRRPAATAWLKKRETELAAPGAIEKANGPDPLLSKVIDDYIDSTKKKSSRTKIQRLNAAKGYAIGALKCSQIGSEQICAYVEELAKDVKPSTARTYLSHLGGVFAVAKPLWGYPLDYSAMEAARVVLTKMGTVAKSKHRERRPTLDELDKLMTFFGKRRCDAIDMQKVALFAIFSTHRQDEICRIKRATTCCANCRRKRLK
jgi:hypothetical protein